ncbi:MAG: polyprenol monophosphomannose synthase [Myxococcota bacterium]|jgi:dolichol-phosphate mannosyltransferase|nr:polyprenol monophosphomannose synthase [Myxococcota bacterium]
MSESKGYEALRPIILMPTYNERENLGRIVPAIFEVVPFAQVLVIDDGSPDGTGAMADEMAAQDERVQVLHRTAKEGLGKAYVAGFHWALAREYDRIIEMDADFSHQPKYLEPMLRRSLDADVVVGSRYVDGGATANWGFSRRFISRGGGLYARTVLGMKTRDLTAGFVCWRPQVLEALPLDRLHAKGYGFQIELKYRAHCAGFSIAEVPITFPDREAGESKMHGGIVSEALLTVLKLRFGKK